MPVALKNLSGTVQGLLSRPYPDIGQTYYLVDSNYRTQAQGWAKGDRTGPLDLWSERNPGYVFRTGDYSTDGICMQAAIDAMVDFRGDALHFTPGNYSIATTALAVNVPDARWLGPPVSHPVLSRAIVTAAVAAAIAPTAAADRMEVAFLQFVPMTAQTMWNVGAVSGLHMHDCFYNADGIAANVATIFVAIATTAEFCQFTRSYVWIDAAQGPWLNPAGIIKGFSVSDFELYVEAGTWASAINLDGVGQSDCNIGPGYVTGGGTALTTLVTIADKTSNSTHGMVHDIVCSTVGPAANNLIVTTGADAELDMGNCWLMRADATALAATTSAGIGYGG